MPTFSTTPTLQPSVGRGLSRSDHLRPLVGRSAVPTERTLTLVRRTSRPQSTTRPLPSSSGRLERVVRDAAPYFEQSPNVKASLMRMTSRISYTAEVINGFKYHRAFVKLFTV